MKDVIVSFLNFHYSCVYLILINESKILEKFLLIFEKFGNMFLDASFYNFFHLFINNTLYLFFKFISFINICINTILDKFFEAGVIDFLQRILLLCDFSD